MRVEGGTTNAAEGVLVEVGLGPPGSDPEATDDPGFMGAPTWTWSPAAFDDADGEETRFRGSVQPEALGDLAVAARASTDGGETWKPAGRHGDRS